MPAVQISTLRRRRRGGGPDGGGPGGTAPGGGPSGDGSSGTGLAGSVTGSGAATPGPGSFGGGEIPICHSTRLPRSAKITIPRPRRNTPMDNDVRVRQSVAGNYGLLTILPHDK